VPAQKVKVTSPNLRPGDSSGPTAAKKTAKMTEDSGVGRSITESASHQLNSSGP
jgi:hypothetical protein